MSDYNGGRTGNDIVQWALEQLAENIPAPDVIQVQLYLYIFSFDFMMFINYLLLDHG